MSDERDDPATEQPDEQRPADDQAAADAQSTDKAKRKGLSPVAKLVLLAIAIVVAVGLILWYVRYEAHGKFVQETNDAEIRADAVTIAPRTAGYVAQVLVADNQDVRAGQLLARIDPRTVQSQAAQARAQIAEAEATADNARASIREQYATIDQARAQLAAARTKAAYDAAEVARYTPLAATGAETREKLANLRDTAAQSAADVRSQAAALEVQQRRIAGFETQVRQGEAQGAAARAQLASATVDVNQTELKSPINGRVGDKTVTVGQYAAAGTRLMSVVPLDQLYIVANFKETQLALMRVGQPATIKVDALSGTKLRGRVSSVSPGTGAQFSLLPPQNATGNFTKIVQRVPVRISIEATPDARKLLVPGLSVTVSVDTISAKGDLDRIKDEQQHLPGGPR
jgi:membrane fusion protein, multidrug efflux system